MDKCVHQKGIGCTVYGRLKDCRDCDYYETCVDNEEDNEEQERDRFDNC